MTPAELLQWQSGLSCSAVTHSLCVFLPCAGGTAPSSAHSWALPQLSLVGVEGLISCPSPYSAPGVFPTGDSTCRQGWVWVFLLLVKVTAKHFWVFELHKMLSRLALCISPLLSQPARALNSCLIALVRMSLSTARVADGPRAGSGAQLGASGLALVTGTKSFQVLPPRSSVLVPPLRGGTDAAVQEGSTQQVSHKQPPCTRFLPQ